MSDKLLIAQNAFQKFHTMCFWYMREDLIVTEEDLPAIIKGLRENGTHETYQIVDQLCRFEEPSYFRADVSKDRQSVKMEWVRDSAFRFFPTEPDPELGFRLNIWDTAVNKVLAIIARSEIRDYLDILHLHKTKISLGALCWAGAGKDPGWTPELILNEAVRTARYTEADLKRLPLAKPVTLQELKQQWLAAVNSAKELIQKLPPKDLGCLYLDAKGQPFTPNPGAPDFANVRRHFGSLKGAWPKFLE